MPTSTKPLISLRKAGVFGNGRWLVRGVDLDLNSGRIVTLIGPNGSGKSTTAKMALGLLEPDEGRAARGPGVTVGYVPQKLAIDWTLPLTVTRFMTLTGSLSRDAIQVALDRVGIGGLAGAEVRHLSGGEFQRALLARAIARRPSLLVLDEPVQGVDFSGEVALYDLISQIRDEIGCGVLLISHDLHVVMAASDVVICLNGHVCCRGTPGAVAQSAEYRKLFGERAGATLAVYEHHHDHTHLPDGSLAPGAHAGEHSSHETGAHAHHDDAPAPRGAPDAG